MVPTEALYKLAERENIIIEWMSFRGGLRGAYVRCPDFPRPIIVLDKHLNSCEVDLRCVFAEELGHHFTLSGRKIGATNYADRIQISKAEQQAQRWAVDFLVPAHDFCEVWDSGNTSVDTLAEHFGVTEGFIRVRARLIRDALDQAGMLGIG